jgi:hypothetical protein
MPLEDFLMPGESVRYKSTEPVIHENSRYFVYVTDKRLLLHNRVGLFKKDIVVSERLPDIQTMTFQETGILSKSGILTIVTPTKRMKFTGKSSNIKMLYSELQKLITPQPTVEQPAQQIKETIIKEMVLIPCPYCGQMMPATSLFCPNCGARRTK